MHTFEKNPGGVPVLASSLRADTVRKSRDCSADAVFTQELMASIQPTTS